MIISNKVRGVQLFIITLLLFLLQFPLIAKASGSQPISDLPIGSKVVDRSWQWEFKTGNDYSGVGVTKPVTWIIVAKNHYDVGSVTLLAEELIGKYVFDNSTHVTSEGYNNWGKSGTHFSATEGLRPWLNSTGIHTGEGFYQAFSEGFKGSIIATSLINRVWNNGFSYLTSDYVFIPSTSELGDTAHDSTYEIGIVYPYFNGATDSKRIAQLNRVNTSYWTRSPSSNLEEAGVLRFIGNDGIIFSIYAYMINTGVRPVVNMQSAVLVSEFPNGNGVYVILAPPPRVTLRSPANNATIAGRAVTFRWRAADRATKYQVQIRRADGTVFKKRALGNVLQLRQAGFPNNGRRFKWRVRAGNESGWGQWSVYRTFRNGR